MNTFDEIMHLHYSLIPYVRTVYFIVLVIMFARAFCVYRHWLMGLFCASAALSLYQTVAMIVISAFKDEMSKQVRRCLFASSAVSEYIDFAVYFAACLLLIRFINGLMRVEKA